MSVAAAGPSYSFKLRNSIEQEADSALSRLDDLIKTKGYEWLDDYMQGVREAVAKGGKRNAAQAGSTLVNILKTPSKTPRLGTAKKTRTVLAKEKDKENRLRLANAELQNDAEKDSGSCKAKSNPRSILFASALSESNTNTMDVKPLRQMQPIAVTDASNPFIESENTSSSAPTDAVRPLTLSVMSVPQKEKSSGKEYAHSTFESSPDPAQQQRLTHAPPEQITTSTGSPSYPRILEPSTSSRNRHISVDDIPSKSTPHEEQKELDASVLPPSDLEADASPAGEPATGEEAEVYIEVQTQRHDEMAITQEAETLVAQSSTEQESISPSHTSTDPAQETTSNDDYSIPIKDDMVTAVPTSPKTALTTSPKNSFSPSAVTFAALPTRDLPRGRSIGASRHQRLTSHLVESTIPEALPAVKTPGPPASTAFPRPSENGAAASKALRDSKTGGAGAGSSWISRKVLAGSGGEDLRKSVAASKRPSTFDRAMEEESDREADELDDRRRGAPRASEAPLAAQRFSIASKTPQPQHARQTLGPATIARAEQPPTNLSKMIADLQERRAVATFNASVTRAAIPSLQLGRGAQGIAGMGISSGLLGRAALQASLERSRGTESPVITSALDGFDEKSGIASQPVGTANQTLQPGANAQFGPSTTEELNEAVDEILRKISTERQMQDQESSATPQMLIDGATAPGPNVSKTLPHDTDGERATTISSTARTSSTRAEEQEVEELTKRTNALSVGTRVSDRTDSSARTPFKSSSRLTKDSAPLYEKSSKEDAEPRITQSTTPTNSPPRALLYRSSGDHTSFQHTEVSPPAPPVSRANTKSVQESVKPPRGKPEVVDATPRTTHARPLPVKIVGQHSAPLKGLSQSQALSVDSEESESSDSEEERGDKRFDETEVLADEVAKLGEPLHLSSTPKALPEREDSEADESVEEVESNGSRAPSRLGSQSLASSTTTIGLSKSTTAKAKAQAHTPASIARLIDGQKAPAGPINSILKAQQRKAEDEARRAKRIASKEAIEKRKQDERQAKLEELRAKEELERKARLDRLRKQKMERERLEKKRQEQEAARATETFFRDRATSVEPGAPKTTLNHSQGKKAPVISKLAKSTDVPRAKEIASRGNPLQASTAKPPSRVSTLPAEIKGGAGAMRPPIVRVNTNPNAVVSQTTVHTAIQAAPAREPNTRVSVITKQHPPLTTSINGNTADVRAVRPSKKPSILPNQKSIPPKSRESTMKPTRETMKAGMNVAEFQRMIALGGAVPANMRSEDIELSDIGSDFGYESDSSQSDKGEVIPAWAQSPALRKAAATQEKINPSHLFGVMPEFKMETVFDPKLARRPRSSSANWTGQDRLTEQEKLEYAKKMGYKSIDDLALLAFDTSANM